MAVKESTDGRWLSNFPVRFAVPRVLLASLIVSALLLFWNSHSSTEIQQAPDDHEWNKGSSDEQTTPFQEPKQRVHNHAQTNGAVLSDAEAMDMCARHDMKPYADREQRKVYDLFLIGTELSWAEIRMNELYDEVDYFVILESDRTFTNHTKPKHFKNNWDYFSKFKSKIIYHLLDDSAIMDYGAWDREHFARNAMVTQIFPSLIGDQAPNKGDAIIVSDIDEIPKPETVRKLRNCEFPERTGMQAKFTLYSYGLHNLDDPWNHPQATYWQGNKTILPESLRMDSTTYTFLNAAWHCTTCFSTVAEFITKVKSFSHQEFNKPEYTDPEQIVRRVRNGLDLFDRTRIHYETIPRDALDVPSYVAKNSQKFGYLLDRSPSHANFRDYTPAYVGEFNSGDPDEEAF